MILLHVHTHTFSLSLSLSHTHTHTLIVQTTRDGSWNWFISHCKHDLPTDFVCKSSSRVFMHVHSLDIMNSVTGVCWLAGNKFMQHIRLGESRSEGGLILTKLELSFLLISCQSELKAVVRALICSAVWEIKELCARSQRIWLKY